MRTFIAWQSTRFIALGLVVLGFWVAAMPWCLAEETPSASPIVANPNGGWSWFGDERAVIDNDRHLLYVGSLANHAGAGGKAKDGDVEVARVDLKTGQVIGIDVLHHGLLSYGGGDDHNCPSLFVLPDGRCLAAYAGHNNGPTTYFRLYDPDTNQWSDETTFDWNAAIEGGCDFGCTYNNLFYLPATQQVVNISRNHHRCPNVIVSSDFGQHWQYAGQLVKPSAAEGAQGFYVNGYLKYSSQKDRIHLVATERHPRHFNNSLYHGYLEAGALHRTDGTVVDTSLDSQAEADATQLTQVFAGGTTYDDVAMTHTWMADFEAYADGQLAMLFKARADDSIEDHRFLYARCNEGTWQVSPLAKAGGRLFGSEQDYTGLGALDPNDPNTLYISTPIDPQTGKSTKFHEIYRGTSADEGLTWTWQAITRDSAADNLRPIIPRWAPGHTALIWNQGTMIRSQNYDMRVMLLLDPLPAPPKQ
ncbi:BNR-4 repeat-containing protein [Aeoliella mucimassa]|uniref:BNR/Asp-box repeat protein n=1 Tax=Aeoliella mucimassa TaxID=2527972 RepID=A0A518AJA3_9BACT|nr:BNR-4 repeat-containing protein [Aeoliella mucimassa]QDU54813.1 hypothetical protein Pan181_09960 [Aeoliella mucimassa]